MLKNMVEAGRLQMAL